jgi:hypothetical protein
VSISSLSYPARKARAPCFIVMRGFSGKKTNFSTLSQKRHDFRGKKSEDKNVCFGVLYKFCLKNLSF